MLNLNKMTNVLPPPPGGGLPSQQDPSSTLIRGAGQQEQLQQHLQPAERQRPTSYDQLSSLQAAAIVTQLAELKKQFREAGEAFQTKQALLQSRLDAANRELDRERAENKMVTATQEEKLASYDSELRSLHERNVELESELCSAFERLAAESAALGKTKQILVDKEEELKAETRKKDAALKYARDTTERASVAETLVDRLKAELISAKVMGTLLEEQAEHDVAVVQDGSGGAGGEAGTDEAGEEELHAAAAKKGVEERETAFHVPEVEANAKLVPGASSMKENKNTPRVHAPADDGAAGSGRSEGQEDQRQHNGMAAGSRGSRGGPEGAGAEALSPPLPVLLQENSCEAVQSEALK